VPTPGTLIRNRGVPAVTVVMPHENQERYFDPEANDIELLVAGDPVIDRLRASQRFRDAYRRAMGVSDGQRLVVLSSTWGTRSLFATQPELALQLLSELPCDEYRVAAILHPNIWIGHSAWQVRTWLRRSIEAGLVLVPPRDAWRAAIVASDLVIADHGSVGFYGAAMGRPILLASFADDELLADSPIAGLAQTSPRLVPGRPLRAQVAAAIDHFDPEANLALADLMFSEPGQSLRITQEAIYRLIDLQLPATKPRVLAVGVPAVEVSPVLAHVAYAESSRESVGSWSFSIERFASTTLAGGGGGGG
jgi:CDP-glycerol glycerophosphotransferase (TagB/SpsB family)